jgi:uncharacterized protein (DUF2384 family)
VAIVVHITNTPKADVRQAYAASWTRFDEHGARHPSGRQSHTAWLVGDVLHVVDVWDSEEDMNTFMQIAGQVIAESDMQLAGPPEVGELLNVVTPLPQLL